jgi:hypothetical protein
LNWDNVSESSRTVRLFRAALPESVVAHAFRALVARAPILFRGIQPAAPDFDVGSVILVLEHSALVHAALTLLARIDCAWNESESARLVSTLRARAVALNGPRGIRLVALTLFSAIVTHLLITRFNAPEPSAMARAVWVALLILLAAAMAGADGVATAWRERSARRSRNESEIG